MSIEVVLIGALVLALLLVIVMAFALMRSRTGGQMDSALPELLKALHDDQLRANERL